MKNSMTERWGFGAGLRLVMFLVCLGLTAVANSQEVLPGAQTGTVQQLRQDDGRITLSGRNYRFDYEVTRVFLAGKEVDSAILDEGMVVRYTLNNQGTLVRIEIIGPAAKLSILEQN